MKMERNKTETIFLKDIDHVLAGKELIEQAGITTLSFVQDPNPTEFKPFIPIEKGVRELVRGTALEEAGCQVTNLYRFREIGFIIVRDINNEVISKESIKNLPKEISELLIPPPHLHYDWNCAIWWKLGNFERLLSQYATENGCLLIPNALLMIFPDEIQDLRKGKTIIPQHWSGIEYILKGSLDTFGIDEKGNLNRVWAYFLD